MRLKILPCFAVATLFTAALNTSANLLAHFFDEEWSAACRANLVDGAVPQGIFARRILAAGKK